MKLPFPFDLNLLSTNYKFCGLLVLAFMQLQCWVCFASKVEGTVTKSSNGNYVKFGEADVNIVGYGEDCSSEGPFCDPRQHLACDIEEELCVCDDKNGYIHVGNLKDSWFNDDKEEKKICMKHTVLEEKLERLLNITKKIQNFGGILRKYEKYLPKKYKDLLNDEL